MRTISVSYVIPSHAATSALSKNVLLQTQLAKLMKCRRVKVMIFSPGVRTRSETWAKTSCLTRRHFISFASCVCNQIFLKSSHPAAFHGFMYGAEIASIILFISHSMEGLSRNASKNVLMIDLKVEKFDQIYASKLLKVSRSNSQWFIKYVRVVISAPPDLI